MGLISEASKEEIRSRVQLEDILRDYNITLLPAGRKLKALCPFHAEKTPSFQVDVEKQFYYCFGCHEGGDLFRFVQKMHHIDFPEALELLARRAGVKLEERSGGSRGIGYGERGKSLLELYDVLHLASDFYHGLLLEDKEGGPAREYLRRRGFEKAMWEKFKLGFSPGDWDRLVRHASGRVSQKASEKTQRVPFEALERAGLARKKEHGAGYYDYFRGRLMFPITDSQNRVIGFGARTLDEETPKYLNTPKTPLFDKSRVLYALPQSRGGIQREGRIGIVEGYTDAIMAHQAGLDFFVANLGTAFTHENARHLSRIAPRVLLIFDGDPAGQKALERSLDLLVVENLDVRIYTVTDGKDPCDAILLLGGEEFRRRFERESAGIFEFKWRRTVDSKDVREAGPAVRARALDDFLELLSRVPNVVARKLYLREFSEKLGIPQEDIEARLKVISRRPGSVQPPPRFLSGPSGDSNSPPGNSPPHGPGNSPPCSPGNSPPCSPGNSPPCSPPEGGMGGVVGVVGVVGMRGEVGDGREGRNPPPYHPRESLPEGERKPGISRESTGLAKVVLECILALPHKANILWAQVPKDLFLSPPLDQLAQAIDRQMEGDGLSPARLAHEVDDFEASGMLLGLLSRLEDENGKPACDYEEVWANVQRDLRRYVMRKRVQELRDLMTAVEARGEKEAFLSLRREYFEALRELKKR